MKIKVKSKELSDLVSLVNQVVPNNPIVPILDSIHFFTKGGKLYLTTSDLRSSITASIDIENEEEFSICVPSKLLTDTLKSLNPQPIFLEFKEEKLNLKTGNGNFIISCSDAQDFPLPKNENVDYITLEADGLYSAIESTSFAVSDDDIRPAITGIYFDSEGESLVCVSTDAHKLSKVTCHGKLPKSFILPHKSAVLIKNIIKDCSSISVKIGNQFMVTTNNITVTSTLIDERFPDYNRVIPDEYTKTLKINKRILYDTIKRVSMYSNKTSNVVALDINHKEIKVFSMDMDYGNEALETINCEYDGEPIKIGFNSKYLMQILYNIQESEVELQLTEHNRPLIIVPNDQRTILIMPVMLNS